MRRAKRSPPNPIRNRKKNVPLDRIRTLRDRVVQSDVGAGDPGEFFREKILRDLRKHGIGENIFGLGDPRFDLLAELFQLGSDFLARTAEIGRAHV